MSSEIKFADTVAAEMENVWDNLARVRHAEINSLGDIPLVVLAHTKLEVIPGVRLPPEDGQVWLELQAELASLSPQGRLVRVEDSFTTSSTNDPTWSSMRSAPWFPMPAS